MSPEPRLLTGIPVLPSLDLEATLEFFESKLGFRRHIESKDYCGVERDGIQIHFWLCADPELPKNSSCRINMTGVDDLYEDCRTAGVVHPNGALDTKEWGFREFSVRAPDGNVVVFAEEVPNWVQE